jgi:hypothetical protein
MKSNQFIHTYFKSEQIESLLLLAIGLITMTEAFYFFWSNGFRPYYKGLAWPLLWIGMVEVIFGASVYFRSLVDVRKIEQYFDQQPQKLLQEELPRMQKLMKSYVIYRWFEVALTVIGLLLIIAMNSSSDFWMGIGTGLLFQGGVMLVSDYFAERRGAVYIRELKEINQ